MDDGIYSANSSIWMLSENLVYWHVHSVTNLPLDGQNLLHWEGSNNCTEHVFGVDIHEKV